MILRQRFKKGPHMWCKHDDLEVHGSVVRVVDTHFAQFVNEIGDFICLVLRKVYMTSRRGSDGRRDLIFGFLFLGLWIRLLLLLLLLLLGDWTHLFFLQVRVAGSI